MIHIPSALHCMQTSDETSCRTSEASDTAISSSIPGFHTPLIGLSNDK